MQGYKQAHVNPTIWGCKYARIEASTYEPEDIRMWGCKGTSKMRGYKQVHRNIRIWGCEDTRGYKQVKCIKHAGYFQTSHQSIYLMIVSVYLDMTIYLMVYIYLYSSARYTKHYSKLRARCKSRVMENPCSSFKIEPKWQWKQVSWC